MTQKNSRHIINISDMSNLGYGIGRIGGAAVFVAGAVDGDIAEVKIIKVTNNYFVARLENIIKPSPHRIEPICAAADRCGGCLYQRITYNHELELKKRFIINAFKKEQIDIILEDIFTTKEISGYRNKIQLPVGEDNSVGFYAARSHDIIENTGCMLQTAELDAPAAYITSFIKKYSLGKIIKHIYLRHAKGTGEIMACIVARQNEFPNTAELIDNLTSKFPKITSIMLNINEKDTNVILGDKFRTLFGRDYIEDLLCGLRFKIAAPAFYQVNHGAAEILYKKIGEYAALNGGNKIVDLYCGTGTIGLYLASICPSAHITGVEIVEEAVENARSNAVINGIYNANFITSDVTAAADVIKGANLLVVDPPRKGLSRELIAKICKLEPERMIYVSCAPDTLARDIRLLGEGGYTVDRCAAVDMFPRTGHVETCVLMSRVKE